MSPEGPASVSAALRIHSSTGLWLSGTSRPYHGLGNTGTLSFSSCTDTRTTTLAKLGSRPPSLANTAVFESFPAGLLTANHIQPYTGSSMQNSSSSGSTTAEEASRGVAVEKLDLMKKWGLNTYKTVDLELEAQIEVLRDTKRKYENVLRLARALTNHLYSMVQTQHALGDTFTDLSQKSPELRDEFGYNAETQKLLCKNGETLLGAINFFVSSINTLVNKTMEDTLMSIKMYEAARDAVSMARIDTAQEQYQIHKDKYERLRSDVTIKLNFLDENKTVPTPETERQLLFPSPQTLNKTINDNSTVIRLDRRPDAKDVKV
ncbi:unnamed protein product [Coregonus sp. 'balchen']|nr:unnamed protein product [Coregonus sp. 'balchen']